MNKLFLLAGTVLALLLPHNAAAQGFINPFAGTTLSSPTDAGSHTKPGFGVAFGSVGKVVGAETEFAYFPELIDNSANALAKSRVISLSASTLIGPKIGAVKPYFAFGFGNLRLNVTKASSVLVPDPESISSNHFTFNAGGGVMGFFMEHLGARGDLRYTKAFGFKLTDLEGAGLSLDKFNFWRATFGLVVKF
jgi:opacity protein-like surface antigen